MKFLKGILTITLLFLATMMFSQIRYDISDRLQKHLESNGTPIDSSLVWTKIDGELIFIRWQDFINAISVSVGTDVGELRINEDTIFHTSSSGSIDTILLVRDIGGIFEGTNNNDTIRVTNSKLRSTSWTIDGTFTDFGFDNITGFSISSTGSLNPLRLYNPTAGSGTTMQYQTPDQLWVLGFTQSGTDRFYLQDVNAGTTPFVIEESSPNDALRVLVTGQLKAAGYDVTPFMGVPFGLIAHQTDGTFISTSWDQVKDSLLTNGIIPVDQGDFYTINDSTLVHVSSQGVRDTITVVGGGIDANLARNTLTWTGNTTHNQAGFTNRLNNVGNFILDQGISSSNRLIYGSNGLEVASSGGGVNVSFFVSDGFGMSTASIGPNGTTIIQTTDAGITINRGIYGFINLNDVPGGALFEVLVDTIQLNSSQGLSLNSNIGVYTMNPPTLGTVSDQLLSINTTTNRINRLRLGIEVQEFDSDLEAIADNVVNGFYARTSTGNVSARTLQEGDFINILNPDGVAGDPVISTDTTGFWDKYGGGSAPTLVADQVVYGNYEQESALEYHEAEDSLNLNGVLTVNGVSGITPTTTKILRDGVLEFDRNTAAAGVWMRLKPLQQTEDNPNFNFNIESATSAFSDRNNDVMSFGWNLLAGGTREKLDQHAMGLSFEPNFTPNGTDTIPELHYRVIGLDDLEKRVFSYVTPINDLSQWYGYNSVNTFYHFDPASGAQWLKGQRVDANQTTFDISAGLTKFTQHYLNGAGNYYAIIPSGMGATPELYLNSWYHTYLSRAIVQTLPAETANIFLGRAPGTNYIVGITPQEAADTIANYITIDGDAITGRTDNYIQTGNAVGGLDQNIGFQYDEVTDVLRVDSAATFNGVSGLTATTVKVLKDGLLEWDGDFGDTPLSERVIWTARSPQKNQGNSDFLLSVHSANYGEDRNNQSWFIGLGKQTDTTSVGFQFEDHFQGTHEVHLILRDSSGTTFRPATWGLSKSTDHSGWSLQNYLQQFRIHDPDVVPSGNDGRYFGVSKINGESSNIVLLGSAASTGGGADGIEMITNTLSDQFDIKPFGSMPTTAGMYTNQFGFNYVNRLGIQTDWGTFLGSNGNPVYLYGGESLYGGFVIVPWNEAADSVETYITFPAGDDWGADVVNTDATLTGDGTVGDVLKADTTILSTKHYVDSLNALIPITKHIKGATIQLPTASENVTLFYTDHAITITRISDAVLGTTPSVTYNIRFAAARNEGSPTDVFSSNRTANTEAGTTTTTITGDATIPANQWVWLITSAASGTINDFNVSIQYTQD